MGPSLLWSLLPLPVGAGAREEGVRGEMVMGESGPHVCCSQLLTLKVRGGVGGWKASLKEACTAVTGIVDSAGYGRQDYGSE